MFESECPDRQHGFIKDALVFDDVGKDFSVAGPAGGGHLVSHPFGTQRHDPVHGSYAFGADLNAFHASRAVPHAARFIEGVQASGSGGIPRIGHEAIGFRQRRGSHKIFVDLQDRAIGDADAAHDATHDAGQMGHGLGRGGVFSFGSRSLRLQPGLNLSDLGPEGSHIRDEVFNHGHIVHGLHFDRAA